MRVSGLRSGALCGNSICAQAVDVQVTGGEDCGGAGSCTRYGVEFDYENANPSEPLECTTSTQSSESDFVGGLIKKGFDAAPDLDEETFKGNAGLGQLLGLFQKVVQAGDSPEDIEASIAPLGPDGKPIESKRVGTRPTGHAPPVPRVVDLPKASGHLLIPMYEAADNQGQTKTKRVHCTHSGEPVLEVTFRLHE